MNSQETFEIVLNLTRNFSLALLILLVPSEFFFFLQKRNSLYVSIFIGVLLGVISLVTRLSPVYLTPVVKMDTHILLTIIAGAVGGIPAALTAAGLIILSGLLVFNENMLVLGATTFSAMLLGIAFHWQKGNFKKLKLPFHLILAVVVSICSLIFIPIMRPAVRTAILPIAIPVCILYGTFTAILSNLFSQVVDHARLSQRSIQLNRALNMTRECDRALVRATEETALLENICQIIVHSNPDFMVWVGYPQHDENSKIIPVARAGQNIEYLNQISLSWENNPLGNGPAGQAIRNRSYYLCRDIPNDSSFFWKQIALDYGLKSVISLPLLDGESVLGVILIYANRVDAFDHEEILLLNDLSNDLAFGIKSLRLKAENETFQTALQQSERQLSSIFEVIPESIMIFTQDGEILAVNSGFTHFTGYTPQEILHMSNLTGLIWADPQNLGRVSRFIEENGLLTNFEVQLRRKNGEYAPVLMQAVSIQYNGQNCILAISADISSLKQSEADLRRSENIKRILIDSTDDLVVLINIEGIILEANEATVAHYKMSRNQIIGKPVFDLFSPEVSHRRHIHFEEAIKNKRSVRFEDYNNQRWSEIIVSPGLSDQQEFLYLSVVSRDITARKNAEKALQQSEEAYRSLAATLENRISNRTGELEVLYKVSSIFNSNLALKDMLERVLAQTVEGIHVQQGTLYLLGKSGSLLNDLNLAAAYGMSEIMKAGVFTPDCPIIEVASTRENLYLADMSKINSCIFCPGSSMKTSGQTRSYLGIPLNTYGKMIGVLNIYGKVGHSYSKDDINLLETLADLMAISVENYRLRENNME
ncbi:MAG: PAS domain S-box protein [Anaerolineae bacterium]|nr:PAS domain S-box protein [Anaerolineae bacterium]